MASQAINLGGQPTLYRPEFARQAKKLTLLGATDIQLADFFGVTEQTLTNWKHAHPRFFLSLKVGKANDMSVERSLYRRAVGYSFDSVKVFCNAKGEVTEVPYREHVPPDTTAMIFWLKNRKRSEWSDRVDVNVTVDFSAKLAEARGRVTRQIEAESVVQEPL
jgi:hypothetical protein